MEWLLRSNLPDAERQAFPKAKDSLPYTLFLRQLVTFFTIVDYASNFNSEAGQECKVTEEIARKALKKACEVGKVGADEIEMMVIHGISQISENG